jgi:hypothetical protein
MARKTRIFNELADRNTRDEENGVISPRALQVKRKVFTSLFGKKDTIKENNSGGKSKSHGLCVAISDGAGEAIESWYVTCNELEDENSNYSASVCVILPLCVLFCLCVCYSASVCVILPLCV